MVRRDPLGGIRDDVVNALERALIECGESDNPYHFVHGRRYARSLEITLKMLDEVGGTRLLEIGTSFVLARALHIVKPDIDVWTTQMRGGVNGESDSRPPGSGYAENWPVARIPLGLSGHTVSGWVADLEDEGTGEGWGGMAGEFDAVLLLEVLEHAERDPMQMILHCAAALRDGGRMLVSTPNICSSHGIMKMLAGIVPYFYMQYGTDRHLHRHNYEYSAGALRALSEGAGLRVVALWSEDTWEEPNPDAMSVLQTLARAGLGVGVRRGDLGDNLFAVLERPEGWSEREVVNRWPAPVYDTWR